MDDEKLFFSDLLKAFDTVYQNVLLHKLTSLRICQNTFKRFQSYFANRKQCISWKGVLSREKDISLGVHQGYILGPLFCIRYINDYSTCPKH